ncbi:hypothetical protein AB0B79_25825 [Streptomyces sp. NPDC039022]|uniref:hypothetical protein n=1 Tax=unclassified Streptomyces TaxID=2593676 RepID=UPI0033EEBBD8
MLAFAFILVAMLAVLGIVASASRAPAGLLPAYRAAALIITAAAYAVALLR